jgi:hypothetical protein
MIVIVANGGDAAAASLAAHWGAKSAILTPEDLSASGWRQSLGHIKDGGLNDSVVVQQRVIPQREITGVLTRLPAVHAADLPDIDPEDRDYVAAEMTAFLLFWLSRLRCPVINRPTAMSLSGPLWRPEQWVHAAAVLGIAVSAVRRHSRAEWQRAVPPSARAVNVIGGRCFGEAHPNLVSSARRLAEAAGVALLSVVFSSPDADATFIGAELFPPLDSDEEKAATLDFLGSAMAAA